MNKKTDIIIITIVVVCVVGYFIWFNKGSNKNPIDGATVNATAEVNKKAAAQSVNPFNTQTTNPLNNVETNPLNKVKVNPFQ